MNRIPVVRVAVPALLALALAAPATVHALELGADAPQRTVRMKGVDGRMTSIASAAGPKGTLVVFTCNHCPWVKAWESRIVRVAAEAKRAGVGVIAVNSNDPATYPDDSFAHMRKQARAGGYAFPYVVDATSEVGRAFGATRTPEAFLFDAEWRLVYHGAVDDNAREPEKVTATWLADAVTAVAGGKAVPTPETKALGCSIKFRPRAD